MDKYLNFEQLVAAEQENRDFRVVIRDFPGSGTVIIAPHGGGIEPGTSKIAQRIAGDDLSLALFEGIKPEGNTNLHITSVRFDEPRFLAHVGKADQVIAIHGEGSAQETVYLGGSDHKLAGYILESLREYHFRVEKHLDPQLQGLSPQNICNKGARGKGVQLELARGLRESFFHSLTAEGRRHATARLDDFAKAVREGLHRADTRIQTKGPFHTF